jgi:predicted NACHT family NTPase
VTLRAMSHRTKDGMGPGEFSHEAQESLPLLRMCEAEGCDGMVVLGNPGSGKTTLLKYLAWGLAGSQTRRNFPPTGFHFFFP